MEQEKAARAAMEKEQRRRYDIEITRVMPDIVKGEVKHKLDKTTLKNVQPPGANNVGFMLFIGEGGQHQFPVSQIVEMVLTETEPAPAPMISVPTLVQA